LPLQIVDRKFHKECLTLCETLCPLWRKVFASK
jgi:hypothetical protein